MTRAQILAKLKVRLGQAQKVRDWAERYGKRNSLTPDSVLRVMADVLRDAELTRRDATPTKERQRKAAQIAAMALKLAKAIERSPEYFPPVLALLDEDAAGEIIQAAKLPEPMPAYGVTAAGVLADRFPAQEIPAFLRKLAHHAEHIPAPRDPRPDTGDATARIAVRALRRMFPRMPTPAIAAAIEAAWPESALDAEAVKTLLTRKG